MATFYQSSLWRCINETIYKKPVFECVLSGTTYRGTIKQMSIAGQAMRWSMIHGVRLATLDRFDEQFHQDLLAYKRDHKTGRDLFLQIGIDMSVAAYPTARAAVHETQAQDRLQYVDRDMLSWYDLRVTCREHMPHATLVLPTNGTMDEWQKACSTSGKRMVNKAGKAGLSFDILTNEPQWRAFWRLWYAMSYDKGFAVIAEDHFVALMDMLTTTGNGWLFVAKKDDEIVSGSVCVVFGTQLVYLYGATDRAYGNIGAHYRLTLHIRARARDHGYTSFDLLGIAEPGSDEQHHLAGVTRFKQSFGGDTIVFAGSYDLVTSARGYRAFKAWRSLRKL